MLPQLLRKLLVAAAFVGIITTCSPLTNRAVPSSFNLYVYGPGNIGGFPVVYNNGSTAAVDPALFTARSDLVNVTCKDSLVS
ncbi:hypothetical protein H2203_003167 [Taxawa tesnikishii (nom. ined.)]|nr:hypothetical protein H2203_003167 [Dothideales sp. JES 119]